MGGMHPRKEKLPTLVTWSDVIINNIYKVTLEGPLEGKISRGRSRTEWVTNLKEWTGMRYEDLVRLAQYWKQWRFMTAHFLEEDST